MKWSHHTNGICDVDVTVNGVRYVALITEGRGRQVHSVKVCILEARERHVGALRGVARLRYVTAFENKKKKVYRHTYTPKVEGWALHSPGF